MRLALPRWRLAAAAGRGGRLAAALLAAAAAACWTAPLPYTGRLTLCCPAAPWRLGLGSHGDGGRRRVTMSAIQYPRKFNLHLAPKKLKRKQRIGRRRADKREWIGPPDPVELRANPDWAYNRAKEAPPATLAPVSSVVRQPQDVVQALTIQGAQEILATLRGSKLVDNRLWKLPLGWYALHSAQEPINEERASRTRLAWPDVPPEDSLPHGAIMGLVYFKAHLTANQCRQGYIWVRGPVCHLISKAIELPEPVPCRGGGHGEAGQALWRIPDAEREEVQRQVSEALVTDFDFLSVMG